MIMANRPKWRVMGSRLIHQYLRALGATLKQQLSEPGAGFVKRLPALMMPAGTAAVLNEGLRTLFGLRGILDRIHCIETSGIRVFLDALVQGLAVQAR